MKSLIGSIIILFVVYLFIGDEVNADIQSASLTSALEHVNEVSPWSSDACKMAAALTLEGRYSQVDANADDLACAKTIVSSIMFN